MTKSEIIQAALALPTDARAQVMKILADSLLQVNKDIEQVWLEEADARFRAFKCGEMNAVPGDEVLARLRKRISC